MIKKDIVIIGGGASGMMCAVKAKEKYSDKSVVILEKQPRIGRKLLSTGNGRCNLTNLSCSGTDYSGSFAKYAESVLGKVSPEAVIESFNNMGLLTYADDEGRVYPLSNQASAVLDVLRFRLESLGVEIICDCKVTKIADENKHFIITTENALYRTEKLVISTGSCAAPKLGADSSGIEILKSLGHRTVPLSPVLCPLPVVGKISPLKGVRANAAVTLLDGKKIISEEQGEVQFTESTLSGICVFNLSSKTKNLRSPVVSINLMPQMTSDEVIGMLKIKRIIFSQRPIEDFLIGTVNKKLGIFIMKASLSKSLASIVCELSDEDIAKIARNLTALSFKVSAPTDFNSAQAASGGVHGDEIDPNTMQSKKIKNLYIIGEAVDVDGICGGYNLQFAFASGIIAGESL